MASLGESVDYQIELHDTSGAQIGSTLSGSLGAWQTFRYLDIFGAVGAPAGDFTNARARFVVTNTPGAPALIGFCTVQDNVYFGADFRVAKSRDGLDDGQRRVQCRGGNSDCTDVGASPFQITNVTLKDGYRLPIHPPDFVRCTILGSQATSLELALLPIGSFAPARHRARGRHQHAKLLLRSPIHSATTKSPIFATGLFFRWVPDNDLFERPPLRILELTRFRGHPIL